MLEPDPEIAVAYGLFSVRQARAAGYSRADIERMVRCGRWGRLERGILLAAGHERCPQDELLLALLRAGPGAVAAFESAGWVLGWDAFDRLPKPRLIMPLAQSHRNGYRARLLADDIVLRGVLTVTSPLRTAWDIAARATYEQSVIAIDSALRSGQVTLQELTGYFDSAHRHGAKAARAALDFADPLAGSVAESEARLLFQRGGLPAPESQYPVRLGDKIGYLDFVWEEWRLAAEIDGFRYHSEDDAFQQDRTKQNGVQLGGLLVLRFTLRDVRQRGERVVAEVWRGSRR